MPFGLEGSNIFTMDMVAPLVTAVRFSSVIASCRLSFDPEFVKGAIPSCHAVSTDACKSSVFCLLWWTRISIQEDMGLSGTGASAQLGGKVTPKA